MGKLVHGRLDLADSVFSTANPARLTLVGAEEDDPGSISTGCSTFQTWKVRKLSI
jgi:hypothetical protein